MGYVCGWAFPRPRMVLPPLHEKLGHQMKRSWTSNTLWYGLGVVVVFTAVWLDCARAQRLGEPAEPISAMLLGLGIAFVTVLALKVICERWSQQHWED
jgi:hypothetical protein